MSQYKAIAMKAKDNVATVTEDIAAGSEIKIPVGDEILHVLVTENIRFGHKIAIRPIGKDEKIIKYGEVIGVATADIKPGQHTHVHN
ncbi:MAG TPA: UxaA family hydrolase, partial [Patescibacteria group bacterium]|nr:UxaA family hydrolase [Patescibacteria group bacterium]